MTQNMAAFIEERQSDLITQTEAARAAHTGAGLEMRNAISAARVSFDALREGLVGIRSHTADVLGKALERMEQLTVPAA
jgi:hypothetical protein